MDAIWFGFKIAAGMALFIVFIIAARFLWDVLGDAARYFGSKLRWMNKPISLRTKKQPWEPRPWWQPWWLGF